MDIDVNVLRSTVTVLSFICFAGIVVWAWSRRNQPGFEQAAQLPFLGDDDGQRAASQGRSNPVRGEQA